MAILNILLIITAVTSSVLKSSARQWLIVPESSSSDCQPYTTGICSTLTQLSSQLNGTGDITLTFFPGDRLLTWNMSLCGVDNVTFNSKQLRADDSPRIICLYKKEIITITRIKQFTIEGLEVHGCGGIHLISTTAKISMSLFINNSAEFGGALYLSHSNVDIYSSIFQLTEHTEVVEEHWKLVTAMLVSLTHCSRVTVLLGMVELFMHTHPPQSPNCTSEDAHSSATTLIMEVPLPHVLHILNII